MKNLRHYFRVKLKSIVAILLTFMFVFAPLSQVLALDLDNVWVNGTLIYSVTSGYNDEHGIEGVTFDVGATTLNLTDAILENIQAQGDLIINLAGTNTITSTSPDPAIFIEDGSLTFIGDDAAITIQAYTDDHTAIRIGEDKRLTIGDEENLSNSIIVTIANGSNINTEDTYVVAGNTYNYTAPGGGPDPGDLDLQVSIGDLLIIDEANDVSSYDGDGFVVVQEPHGGYSINIDSAINPTIDAIQAIGDGMISLNAIGGEVVITQEGGYSINADGNVGILTMMGSETYDLLLEGGIYTHGGVIVGDGDLIIGSEEESSAYGILAGMVSTASGDLHIYTTGVAFAYYDDDPLPGQAMRLSAQDDSTIFVSSSLIATENVESVLVLSGGSIDLNYSENLGDFDSQAGHWTWSEFLGTEDENIDPVIVDCEPGEHPEDDYNLTFTEGRFLLESTANPMYPLGYNYDDSEDSRVVNGSVNVKAAKGYKFVTGGGNFFDFVIEAGSEVTIELLPDYGYQYVSGGINGQPTTPEAGKASYTFIMPEGPVHISAIFEKTDDMISIASPLVEDASIGLPPGTIHGNAEFLVGTASSVNTAAFADAAGSSTLGGYIDLSMNEVIYKGSREDSWKTGVAELEDEMAVNLELSDKLQGHSEYTIFRDHEGVVEELEATYDPGTGVLSFNTDSYSTYAVAYSDIVNPRTSDDIMVYVITAAISMIGLCGVGLYTFKGSFLRKIGGIR